VVGPRGSAIQEFRIIAEFLTRARRLWRLFRVSARENEQRLRWRPLRVPRRYRTENEPALLLARADAHGGLGAL
jgi:hypothetical protein